MKPSYQGKVIGYKNFGRGRGNIQASAKLQPILNILNLKYLKLKYLKLKNNFTI